MIKLISFDIWKTLIKSNPAYVQLRAERIASALGLDDRVTEVKEAIRLASNRLDDHTDHTGIQHGVEDRLVMTAEIVEAAPLGDRGMRTLSQELHDLHVANLPSLMEPSLPDTLTALRNMGLEIAVISNTGMSSGKTLRAIFDGLGILTSIDHPVFSDEVGVAKPDPEIFAKLVTISGIEPASILHVGDNPLADVGGATAKGLHARLYTPGTDAVEGTISSHASLLTDALVASGRKVRS